MRVLAIFLIVLLGSCSNKSNWISAEEQSVEEYSAYQTKVKNYQDSISNLFMSGMNGVMPKSEISATEMLPYFEPNESFVLIWAYLGERVHSIGFQ